ncbi:MAG: DNA alkylation repair protein [Lactobacillales bacterium]|jgi:3-methyladenine DNA glycosylase AlkD|nr:DNA alkylation repair protein [Lactobacillales bacterium]
MEKLVLHENLEKKPQMERYMKNNFAFKGIQKTELVLLAKETIQVSKKISPEKLFEEVSYYYKLPEREYHYLAILLLEKNINRLNYSQILTYIPFVSVHSWWDSVDAWRKVFALWGARNPDYLERVFYIFQNSEDFWQRRIAINLQLLFRKKTNTKLLTEAIEKDLATDEFFIQKAIGWSLREYSKTNPSWVTDFIATHPTLSKLAIREGSKYL